MSNGNVVTGSPPRFYTQRVWSGADGKYELVDGFYRLKNNSYSCTFDDVRQTQSEPSNDYVPPRSFYMDFAGYSDDWNNNDSVKILSKLATKVSDTEFDLGNYLVEGKQSLDMVLNGVKTVGGALLDIKRGNFAKAARRLGVKKTTTRLGPLDLSGRWLELIYGWSPIIDDVYSASKALESLTAEPRSKIYRVKTFRQSNFDGSASPINFSCKATIKFAQKIVYEMNESLPIQRKLGLQDPLGIAWEGLPYSFVADWFIPIGSYLNALNVIPLLKGRYVWTRAKVVDYPQFKVLNNLYKGATSEKHSKIITRTVGTGFTALNIPPPTFKTISEASSPIHIANAIALLHQAVHGVSHPQGI